MVDAKDQVYPSGADPVWSMLIAEKLDSIVGTPGDNVTVTITLTTPTNKHVWISTNDFNRELTTTDKTDHFPGGTGNTVLLGQVFWKATSGKTIVHAADEEQLTLLTDQLQDWMIQGNAQTNIKLVYLAVRRRNAAGNWRWKTWKQDGVKQNWMICKISKFKEKNKNSLITFDMAFEQS